MSVCVEVIRCVDSDSQGGALRVGLYTILQLPIVCGVELYFNNGGSVGNIILRNSAGDDGVGWGT